MEYKDYYKILGINRDASNEEIKQVYRKLAMQYHPDRNPGDKHAEERFKEINEAYQVLGDAQKRARYDQLGESYARWQQNGTPGNFNWGEWSTQPAGGVSMNLDDLLGGGAFSEFFNFIFGGTAAASRGRRRASSRQQQVVQISLQEAYLGTTRQIHASGRQLEVKIPAGAATGTKIRLPGAGPASPNGQPVDLYLVLEVVEDAVFDREGDDLHTQISLDVFTAILGGEVEVKTLSGKLILTIPPGTQPEQVFRIAGRGMPDLKNPQHKGNLYVRVRIQIPRNLTARKRALLKEAAGAK